MHVLVVSDDIRENDSLTGDLRRNGHRADTVRTGSAALREHRRADLVLLDLELSDIDGLQVCRAIRADTDTPIISLTDRDDELNRVLVLQAGSDDCLVKPCGLRELLARMEAVMRRARPHRRSTTPIEAGPLHLNPESREVRLDGRPVALTRKEFDLLHLLAGEPATVFSRKQIMAKVWGHVWTSSSRTIDMHVSGLRRKLGSESWIVTVRGVGFRLGHP